MVNKMVSIAYRDPQVWRGLQPALSKAHIRLRPVDTLVRVKDWTNGLVVTTLARWLAYATRVDGSVVLAEDGDSILLSKIAEGDNAAVGTLYSRHHKRVYHFVKRFVNQSDVAEDVTNDVFIEVWQKASTFEGRSKVSSWILGMARYKALSEIRKRKNVHSASDEVFDAIEDDADTPEVVTQKLDKGTALKACIAALSKDHRVVLDLVYYHEKSISEVSEILDIPASTVKTRAHYARKLLSAEMARNGVDRGWP